MPGRLGAEVVAHVEGALEGVGVAVEDREHVEDGSEDLAVRALGRPADKVLKC